VVLARGRAASAPDDGAAYELRAADATVALGAQTAISFTIAPVAGRTVSHDGPVRVDLATDEGLIATRKRYARRDAADPAADAPRFDLKVKGIAAGDHTLDVDVHFWLCGARTCRPVRAQKTLIVHVAAPPSPDAALPLDAAPPPDAPRRR
jgi:hypothetical protein